MLSRIVIVVFLVTGVSAQQERLASLYSQAQEATAAGNQALAAATYEQIIKLAPTMAEAYANLGNAYYSLAKPEEAAKAFRQAIRLKPQLTGPHFLMGVIAFNAHHYESAVEHLLTAEKLEPQNLLVQAYLGYTGYARAQYQEAARHLELAEADAGNPEVLYHLSKTYGQLAKKAYGELHVRFPGSLYDHLAQGHAHESAHEWEGALESYRRALEEAPENAAIRRRMDVATARISNVSVPSSVGADETVDASMLLFEAPPTGEKLRESYRELVARKSELAAAASSGESSYREAERFQSLAYLASLRVLEEAPDSPRAHQLKGESLEAGGSNDEAIAEYREALRAAPDLPTLHFAIANIYWKTNRLAEAKPELRNELRIDAGNPQAWYELGDAVADAGDATEAEQCFLKALRLQPHMAEPHLGLDTIYSARGEYPKALLHLRAAAKIDPLDATPHYRLSAVYRKLGMAREAREELEVFSKLKSAEKKSGP